MLGLLLEGSEVEAEIKGCNEQQNNWGAQQPPSDGDQERAILAPAISIAHDSETSGLDSSCNYSKDALVDKVASVVSSHDSGLTDANSRVQCSIAGTLKVSILHPSSAQGAGLDPLNTICPPVEGVDESSVAPVSPGSCQELAGCWQEASTDADDEVPLTCVLVPFTLYPIVLRFKCSNHVVGAYFVALTLTHSSTWL